MKLSGFLCGLMLLLWIAVPAGAQQPGAAATLRGRVLDPQGQGVGARVRVVQVSTGLERESRSDPAGHFALTNIPPGDIDLIVTAQGFAERRINGVRLEVGRAAEVDVMLQVSGIQETVTVAGDAGTVDVLGSVVGSVISAREIETLPLNGRNFLELAFLTPGSAPAPNFDPTKAQSVLFSSAGQAGRGGNITDRRHGQQRRRGRRSVAEHLAGRRAGIPRCHEPVLRRARPVGRVGDQRRHTIRRRHAARIRGRCSSATRAGRRFPRRWTTRDRRSAVRSPADVGNARRPAQPSAESFGFGALEVRNQDGGVLVGIRDTQRGPSGVRSRRAARRSAGNGPPRLARWRHRRRDDPLFGAARGRHQRQHAGSRDRHGIAAAGVRQRHSRRARARGHGVVSPRAVNVTEHQLQRLRQLRSRRSSRAFSTPSRASRPGRRSASRRARRRSDGSSPTRYSLVRGTHQWKFGGAAAADRRAVRSRCVPRRPRRAGRGLPGVRPQRRRPGERRRPAVCGHAAQRKAGQDLVIPDADNVHVAGFVQDDWRVHPRLSLNLGLRYEIDTRREQHQPRRRVESDRRCHSSTEPRQRDTNNLGPRIGFNWSTADARHERARRLRALLRPGRRCRFSRSNVGSTAARCRSRCAPATCSSSMTSPARSRRSRRRCRIRSPASSCRAPARRASTSSTRTCRTPRSSSSRSAWSGSSAPRHVVRVDCLHNHGNGLHHRPDRRHRLQPRRRRSRPRRQSRIEREDQLRRAAGRGRAALFADAIGFRAAYTLVGGEQLRQRRSDSVRQRADRSQRSRARVRSGHQRSAAPAGAVGQSSISAPDSSSRACGRMASGVPMDILMPSGQSRIPTIQRNAGGREFTRRPS